LRNSPLTRDERIILKEMLKRMDVIPDTSGQLLIHITPSGDVTAIEFQKVSRVVWR